MPKLIETKTVRLTGVYELDGTLFESWRDVYLGLEGLLCIYESERFAPGRKFFYFYPNEPEEYYQKYLRTSVGDVTVEGNKMIIESNHRYEFEVGDFFSEIDLKMLMLNVFLI